jgi:pyruvate dehydrogenase E1 component alpha subunit
MERKLLYKALEKAIQIRIAEEKIATNFREQKIFSFLHLYIGQEASAVGISLALKKEDQVWGNHRSHGHYLARGGNYEKMIYEIFGDRRGCCRGYGGSMHMLDRSVGFLGSGPILGSVGPIACGLAAAKKFSNEAGIVIGYLGDGAAEEGAFYESVNLAGLFRVPLLYVIEDNRYSVETDHSHRKVDGYDFSSTFGDGLGAIYRRVNGQDVEEVYNATKELRNLILEKKRIGILHSDVLRNYKHSGANPDEENPYYRKEDTKQYMKENDCIEIMKKKLLNVGEDKNRIKEFSDNQIKQNQKRFNTLINKIVVRK